MDTGRFPDFQSILSDLPVVGAELGIVLVLCLLLGLVARLTLSRSARIPALRDHPDRVAVLRRRIRHLLTLFGCLAGLAVIAFNTWLIYRQEDPYQWVRDRVAAIPPDFWRGLGIQALKVLGLVILALLVIRGLQRLLHHISERAKAFEQLRANNASIEAFFTALTSILTNCIKLLVLIAAVRLFGLPETVSSVLIIVLRIYLIVTIGLLIVKAISAIVDSLDALSKKYSREDNWLRHYEKVSGLMPLLRRCLEYIVYVTVATLVIMQVGFIEHLATYGPRVTQVIGIFFIARVLVELGNLLIERSQTRQEHLTEKERKQRLTLMPLMRSVMKYVVFFAAFVLMLDALNLNPTPLLAGAGIIGIVVGLGAQPLINDLVSGLFILFENLFLVGDYIETADARGIVESIDIRTTRLRDPSGQQHILRNGQIGDIVNFSKRYTFAVIEVGVAYESDLDQVYAVLEKLGQQIREDHDDVLEATKVQGLEEFGESELLVRTITRVKPGRHKQVGRELRKLIKDTFDREGIEIPYARRVLIIKPEEVGPEPPARVENG